MSKTNSIADLLSLNVIILTIGGRDAYLARKGAEFDGAWFTRDLGNAQTYKLARNAEKQIAEHASGWATLAPRVTPKSSIMI